MAGEDRRRHGRAAWIGTALGTLLVAWVATAGSWDLLRWEPLSDFYDAQAAAWLDGRWDIGIDTLGVESFFRFDEEVAALVERGWPIDDDPLVADEILRSQPAYMYQGPVPALLRVPTAALAPDLSGRLTTLSILAATLLAGWTSGRILWEARRRLRPDVEVGRGEQIGVAAWCALVTGGSSLVYLAAKPWVYHEALVWGVALCLASLLAMVRYVDAPTTRRVVVLGLLVTACLSTRASIGLGPLLGVAVLGARELVAVARRRADGRDVWPPITRAAGLAGVGVAALGTYAAVSYVKFRTLFSVPFETQLHTIIDPTRQEFLAENGGFFSLRFIPTTLLQYFRPDAFRPTSLLPWIDFAPAPGPILLDARFDVFDRTSSVPSALPAFVLLGVLALVALGRGRIEWSALRAFRVPLVAAAGSGLAVLAFGYIANRYVADFMPLVIVAAAIGVQALLAWRPSRPWIHRTAVSVVVLAGVFGAWLNVSHGVLAQRLYGLTTDEERTAAFIATQSRVESLLGGEELPSRVQRGEQLPTGSPGDLFVLGSCDALYLHDGNPPNTIRRHSWIPVERTERAGRYELAIRFDALRPGTSSPIVSGEDGDSSALLVVEATDDGHVVVEYSGAGLPRRSAPIEVDPGHTYDAVLVADPRLSEVSLTLDGRLVFEGHLAYDGPLTFGRDVVGGADVATFAGSIERRPGTRAELCADLLERAG
ncbi:hypothetical protein [Actinomarinicola tropica]|uniref:Glycosyltransferase RgtA/B/C/D-like domain-containing protein n=1 Tax=Actinomarinicola tropica TaxID=2789776 RepID=A0A5Q2REW5_9ACTN|nr:hypothetical protein [Actinomarinicola tropica]QGG95359.1 hypothetical protein GH723_09760 [Actinomarinicola tropica]